MPVSRRFTNPVFIYAITGSGSHIATQSLSEDGSNRKKKKSKSIKKKTKKRSLKIKKNKVDGGKDELANFFKDFLITDNEELNLLMSEGIDEDYIILYEILGFINKDFLRDRMNFFLNNFYDIYYAYKLDENDMKFIINCKNIPIYHRNMIVDNFLLSDEDKLIIKAAICNDLDFKLNKEFTQHNDKFIILNNIYENIPYNKDKYYIITEDFMLKDDRTLNLLDESYDKNKQYFIEFNTYDKAGIISDFIRKNGLKNICFIGTVTSTYTYFLLNSPSLVNVSFRGLNYLEKFGGRVLFNCPNLVSVDLNGLNRLRDIGELFIAESRNLVSVNIDSLDNLQNIGPSFLTNCYKLDAKTKELKRNFKLIKALKEDRI